MENTNIKWPIIIISGKKQSGKDELSNMIEWILKNYISIKDANLPLTYENYLNKNNFGKSIFNHNVEKFSFAKNLKKVLSIILDVPDFYFNDNNYKTNYYINLKTFEHIDNTSKKLDLKKNDDIKSLREIMQNLGQYIEPFFGNDIWAKSTLSTVKYLAKLNEQYTYKFISQIITDLRRESELRTVQRMFNESDYIIIRVIRKMTGENWFNNTGLKDAGFKIITPTGWENYNNSFKEEKIDIDEFINRISKSICSSNKIADDIIKTITHETETELDNYSFKYIIENDSSLEDLFNKVYKLLNQYITDKNVKH